MLQQVIAAYHRFVQRPARSRTSVSLQVVALEERATPAAPPTILPLVAVPQTVLVAPTAPMPSSGSLAIPIAGQSIVRLDLIAPCESTPPQSEDDAADLLVQHRQETDVPPAAQPDAEDLALQQEELELLAAQAQE